MGRYKHLEKSFGVEGVRTMQAKTVTVVGLGGIGSACADMLVRSGVGLRIIERSRVEETDIDRLSLFTEKEIGKFKATEAKKLLTNINSEARIKSFNEEVNRESLFLVEADVVLDCSSNDSVTRLLEKYCSEKKIPLVYGQMRDNRAIVVVQQGKCSVMATLENIPHESVEGIRPTVLHIAAAIMVSKTYRLLMGHKIKEEAIIYDVINHTITRPAVKKGPAPKTSSAKKTSPNKEKDASKKAPPKKK